MANTARGFGVVVFAAIVLASATAHAEQVVVFDQTWVHTPELPDSHYRQPPGRDTPADWTSPVDYSQGSAWVYLEVHTKPTEQETKFQVCFEATPTYACTAQSPTYTDVGTYEWETPFVDFWSPPGEFVDWTLGVNNVACILKDTMNGKPSADNVGPEVAALYTPTEVRLVVTLVEAGGVYEPPTPTGATTGDESSGGSSDGSTGGDTSGGETTSSSSTTTGDEATATDVDPTTASASAGTTAAADGSSDTGGATQQGSSEGCACATDPARPLGGLALLALAGLRRRRTTPADRPAAGRTRGGPPQPRARAPR